MALLLFLYTLSGLAGLVFEAVFLRQLAWLLGSDVSATAVVLAVFLGGLALGSALFGPLADRSRRPLRLYGSLEIGAAAAGGLAVWILGSQRGTLLWILRGAGDGALEPVTGFLLAVVLLGVPTLLMGGTVPVLSRFLIRGPGMLLGRFGLLYAANTLGGAAGVVAAGFLLFETVGITSSGYIATSLGAAVGLAAVMLDRTLRTSPAFAAWLDPPAVPMATRAGTGSGERCAERAIPTETQCVQECRKPTPKRSAVGSSRAEMRGGEAGLRAACLLASCLGGAAMLGYEVVWTRLLTLPLRSFTYSFSTMLGLFLMGLVIGGLVIGAIAGRVRRPEILFGWVQIGMGLWVASSVVWLPGLLASPIEAGSFGLFLLSAIWRAAPIVLPPTILSGMALPLAARVFANGADRAASAPRGRQAGAAADGREERKAAAAGQADRRGTLAESRGAAPFAGERQPGDNGGGEPGSGTQRTGDAPGPGWAVGTVYAVNTGGSIGGTLLAWLVLLPLVGAPRSLALLAVVNAASGAAVLLAASAGRGVTAPPGRRAPGRRVASLAAALVPVAVCAAALAPPRERFVRAFLTASPGTHKIAELLFFHEGAADTIAIVRRNYGFYDPGAKSLITNSIAMSATARPVRRYMAVEGHLPVLLARDPKRALVLCVGTGITLGAVASHTDVARIDAVDLSDGVMRGLPYFADENDRAFEDPRVRMVRADGRHFLELAREPYDVITLEPPPPIVAGSSHLYSLDFYRLCREHLAPGGAVAQWLPLHAQSLASARMTARTFCEAFPHVQLWLPSVRDAVLVGSDRPLVLAGDRLRDAWTAPRSRSNLLAAWLESPEAFVGTFLMERASVLSWTGDAPVITDEHPWMEFFRRTGRNMTDADIATLTVVPQAGSAWIAGLEETGGLRGRIEVENRALRRYVRAEVEGDASGNAEAARLSRGTGFFLTTIGCATEQLEYLARSAGHAAAEKQARICASLRESQ